MYLDKMIETAGSGTGQRLLPEGDLLPAARWPFPSRTNRKSRFVTSSNPPMTTVRK